MNASRLYNQSRAPGRAPIPWFRQWPLAIALILASLFLSALGACTSDKYIDPPESPESSGSHLVRYSYAPGNNYTYWSSMERKSYGAVSGETRLLQLDCNDRSRDVQSFVVIDSLLYTSSLTSRFPGNQRTVRSFRMTSSGEAPSGANSLLAAAQPLVPLPGLPTVALIVGSPVVEELPYGHALSENSRVVTSTRRRMLSTAAENDDVILHEEILQVIEIDHPVNNEGDTALFHPAVRSVITTSDTLTITREIELSGFSGHLVKSIETQREVHFNLTSKQAGSPPRGTFTINETVARLELQGVTTR
jgi:hypothetical protein